jgi:hypothetical protein
MSGYFEFLSAYSTLKRRALIMENKNSEDSDLCMRGHFRDIKKLPWWIEFLQQVQCTFLVVDVKGTYEQKNMRNPYEFNKKQYVLIRKVFFKFVSWV